mgnify:CR=1 FL=1
MSVEQRLVNALRAADRVDLESCLGSSFGDAGEGRRALQDDIGVDAAKPG